MYLVSLYGPRSREYLLRTAQFSSLPRSLLLFSNSPAPVYGTTWWVLGMTWNRHCHVVTVGRLVVQLLGVWTNVVILYPNREQLGQKWWRVQILENYWNDDIQSWNNGQSRHIAQIKFINLHKSEWEAVMSLCVRLMSSIRHSQCPACASKKRALLFATGLVFFIGRQYCACLEKATQVDR